MKNKYLFLLLFSLSLNLYSNGITIVEPENDYNSPSFKIKFSWNPVSSQNTYRLRVAKDSLFNVIVEDRIVNGTQIEINLGTTQESLYWKVNTAGGNGFLESRVNKLNFNNPSLNPSILIWLAADSNVVINPDSTISAWNNIIPNGLNAIQNTIGKQPQLVSGVNLLNKKNIVRFDGINDDFSISGGDIIGGGYCIFNYTTGPTFNNYNALLTNTSVTVFDDYYITSSFPGGTILEPIDYFGQNKGTIYLDRLPIPANYSLAPLGKFKLFAGIRNIANRRVSPGISIGSERNFNRFWEGDVAEIIFSKNNTEQESDSIQNYLHNKYAPPIVMKDTIIGSSFCSPVTLSAPNNYTNFLWSTGSTSQFINVNPDKNYSLTVTDVFGRISTTTFKVFPYSRLNNSTFYICKNDTLKIDLKTPPGFTAIWNTGSTNTKVNLTQTGQYTVKITDGGGCFVWDTVNVIVDAPSLNPTLPPSKTISLCLNEKIFISTPTSFDSIRWSTGSNQDIISVLNPGNYTIYARTTSGCVYKDTFNVNITGQAPTANFVFSASCQNTPLNFTDISTPPVGNTITSWKWDFSNGSNSTQQNPSTSFSSLGTQSASLKITTNVGCTDSINKTFTINRKPVPSFINLLSCSGIPTTFVDQSIANAASITNRRWDFAGLGVINDIANPTFNFPSAGTYNVKLVVTNSNSCRDSVSLPADVNISPTSNFSFDSVCGKTPLSFQFLATVPLPNTITTWNWDFGDGTFESAIRNPQKVYNAPGAYNVKLAVRSSNQCVDTIQKQIRVFDFPIVDFDVSQSQCVGKEIQFTDITTTPDGTPITNWNWFFAGQGTSTQQNPRVTFNAQGNYIIQLTAKNAVGCSATKLRSIAVSQVPVPKFTFSPQNGLPPLTVTYTNQSPVGGNYIWNYGDGSPLVNAYNPPQHIYTALGSYPITLVATDFRGCTDSITKFILVDRAYLDGVMASITITPNGDYYKITATIINNSNIEITSLGLNLQLGNGSVIRETWTGSLMPGLSVAYQFVGEIRLSESNQIPVVCASIDNINNNAPEDRIDNNTTCKEVAVGRFDILNVFPSPAFESINFGVMLPKDGEVSIRLVDILGRILYTTNFNGVRGYNNLTVNTAPLNAAVYVAEVYFDGEVVRKKFMRKDRK